MKSFCAVILALVLMLGGCAIGKTVVPEKTKGFPSPQAALEAIKPRNDTDTLYRMTAKVSISSPQGKLNFRLAVIMRSPDRLRLESIPVFGPPDFFLTTQGERFRVYLPGTQEFLMGKASPDNLSRFLPLTWSVERWMAMLQGNKSAAFPVAGKLQGKMEGLLYRIDVFSEDAVTDSLWINLERNRLEKTEQLISAGLKETVVFKSFREINGRDFPASILINTGAGKTLTIVYETIETTNKMEDDLFLLLPPPEASIRELPD